LRPWDILPRHGFLLEYAKWTVDLPSTLLMHKRSCVCVWDGGGLGCVCVCVCVCVCWGGVSERVSECVCVCVCVRERERAFSYNDTPQHVLGSAKRIKLDVDLPKKMIRFVLFQPPWVYAIIPSCKMARHLAVFYIISSQNLE
jgi:hypothetical protein